MQYMLMVYQNEAWDALPKDEKNRIHTESTAWHEELVRRGKARSATGLHPASTATTLRVRNGETLITDGPFAETKEILGGFEIIDADDLDEAIAIAKQFPALQVGFAMEVRPVMEEPCWED